MIGFPVLVVASLLWCCYGGPVTTPETTGGHLISTRMVDSPKKCVSNDSECGDAELLTCDLETKLCKCRERYSVLSISGNKCLPAKQLGEECEEDAQCRVLERNATCTEEKFCACDSGFYKLHDNGTLCSPDKAVGGSEETVRKVDWNMIIILSVLAIMFVGICVALHLFSKARFGNRRSIFNSPHPHLMQKVKGRRKKSSIKTQHLPPPPPPPHLVPRHHSFSGHHSPYTMAKVSKTRSHECLRSALSRPSSPKFEPRPKTAPLAEKESLLSSEDLEKKTPEPLQNGVPNLLSEEESPPKAPGSPTVIITDADGAHTVVTSNTPAPGSAVNV